MMIQRSQFNSYGMFEMNSKENAKNKIEEKAIVFTS